MNKISVAVLMCFAGTAAFGSISFVSSSAGLGANDSASWDQLGGDLTVLGSTFSAMSVNSASISGSFAAPGSVTSVVCPATPSCSWIPSGAGFAAGDSLIVTSDGSGGATGPLTLAFPSALGAGVEIQVDVPGTFTAEIQAFSGATLLGTFTSSSTSSSNNDPIFVGVLDTAAEVTSIMVGLTACGGFGCDPNDFAVDSLLLVDQGSSAPEPSALAGMGGALLALWIWHKRLARSTRLTPAFLGLCVLFHAPWASAQTPIQEPLTQLSRARVAKAVRDSSSIHPRVTPAVTQPGLPLGLYSVVAANGQTYQGSIVGRSPWSRGARTTTVSVVLIPVIVKTPSSSGPIFIQDPTAPDAGCLGAASNTALSLTQSSPIFNAPPSPWTLNGVQVGGLTFNDAHLRGEFWNLIGPAGDAFHLALPFSTAPTQTIDASAEPLLNADTLGYSGSCGTNTTGSTNRTGTISALNIEYLDPVLQNMLGSLGITHDQLALFVMYRTVITEGAANNPGSTCCDLGYHNAPTSTSSITDPGQTYAVAEFDSGELFPGVADVSILAREIGQWINDPTGLNPTPVYSTTGPANCLAGQEDILEVAQPLSAFSTDHTVTMNGFTYHMEELAYFSWFYNADHAGSLGAGTCAGLGSGCMSSNGTLKGPAIPFPQCGSYPN